MSEADSETEEIPFAEWLKKREKLFKEQADDIEKMLKPLVIPNKNFVYDGFEILCRELSDVYRALSFMYEVIFNNDKEIANNLKVFLGLTSKASQEDVKNRAIELGELNERFIKNLEQERRIKASKEREHERFYVR